MADLSQNETKTIDSLKQETIEMLEQAQIMFRTCFDGLIKHDIKILNQVLKDERKMTEVYDNLTASAIESTKGRLSTKTKKAILNLVDIISTIEKTGDTCVTLVERIEYKIRENLLFSEIAVEEYKDLHSKVDQTLSDTIEVMKTSDKRLAKDILKGKSSLEALVEKYKANHIDRSARGICSEWARIRYLDMLDFTKQAALYCLEIADKFI